MAAQNARFVVGIYNYCDYWCERCAFTRRCRNFATGREVEREARGERPVEDAANAAFWNDLAEKLREATVFRDPEPWAPEAGAVEVIPDPDWETREAAHREAVRQHPLSRLALDYRRQAGAWLKDSDADLKAYARGLLDAVRSEFNGDDLEEEARQVGEMIEVVAWYHTFISSKVSRAVGGLLEHGGAGADSGGVLAGIRLEDANGSGKVALMAIDRSMAAWLRLREVLPGHESAILNMLALLERLRRGLGNSLPGAASFRRPGFDGEFGLGEEEDAEDGR